MPEPTKSRKGLGGPKTPEGKAKSSLNAMKSGVYASSRHGLQKLAEEIGVKHEDITEAIFRFYEPRDAIENTLARRISRCVWRIYMTEAMEARMLERQGLPNRPGDTYNAIIRHERVCDLELHRAMTALEKKRDREAKRGAIEQYVKIGNELPDRPFLRLSHACRGRQFVSPESLLEVMNQSQTSQSGD